MTPTLAAIGIAALALALVALYLLAVPAWVVAEALAKRHETPEQRAAREWRYGPA